MRLCRNSGSSYSPSQPITKVSCRPALACGRSMVSTGPLFDSSLLAKASGLWVQSVVTVLQFRFACGQAARAMHEVGCFSKRILVTIGEVACHFVTMCSL